MRNLMEDYNVCQISLEILGDIWYKRKKWCKWIKNKIVRWSDIYQDPYDIFKISDIAKPSNIGRKEMYISAYK